MTDKDAPEIEKCPGSHQWGSLYSPTTVICPICGAGVQVEASPKALHHALVAHHQRYVQKTES